MFTSQLGIVREKLVSLASMKRPSFDFLTLHYMYIIGMTLLGSLLIFAGGEIRYINALFMASSSCTQAGLAVLNVNDLNTYQQVMFLCLASLTNPIVIHSATAFIRLYWFQKRFAHIVKESNLKFNLRKSKSRAQSFEQEERGVNGREIRVLFDSGRNHQLRPSGPRQPTEIDADTPAHSPRNSTDHSTKRVSLSSAVPRKASVTVDEGFDPLITKNESDLGKSPSGSSAMESDDKDMRDMFRDVRDGTKISRPQSIASQAIIDDDFDEKITQQSPPEEPVRNTADIRFAELPVPRKANQEEYGHHRTGSSDSIKPSDSNYFRARVADSGPRTIGSALLEFGQRTMTMDGASRNQKVHHRRASSVSRVGGGRSTTIDRTISTALRRRRDSGSRDRSSQAREVTLPYISFQPTIGRNSAFTSLNREQREELGGIEYRATRTLCWVLVCYYLGFHIFGFICFLVFIFTAQQYIPIVADTGSARGWWSLFSSASAFNDLGLTLTPDSYLSFQNATFLLLVASFLIVIGNTGFPCMLRFVIWLLYKLWPKNSSVKEEFAFLLDHPRRCFTLLFPGSATWWLFGILVFLNGLDLVLFIVLDLGNDEITDIPAGYRIFVGLFQAFCTRTAGFTAVNLAGLHSAILYISVFPVAISIRKTNVYEERSLGIYSAEDEDEHGQQSFVGTHIRRQLGFDLWYVFLALFIICMIFSFRPTAFVANRSGIIENPEIQNSNLQSFNIFNVLFEIVSAYGTVGLSIGFPTVDFSFSGEFHTLSKLVIIALQIRGRHRGLPLRLDRAVLLPSEKQIEREEEDAEFRLGRSLSRSRSVFAGTRERED